MASAPKTALINRRLYRALLRAVKPFTPPSEHAAVLTSLLHRSFIPIAVDESMAMRHREKDSAIMDPQNIESYPMDDNLYPEVDVEVDEDDPSSPQRYDPHFLLFRRLLWTIFSDEYSYNPNLVSTKLVPCYQFPEQVKQQPFKLREIIRQEFRVPDTGVEDYVVDSRKEHPNGYLSAVFPIKARRDAAFLALRRLNEKLAWADELEESLRKTPQNPKQSAKCIQPVIHTRPTNSGDCSAFLTPGTFLVAHPHLSGYFRQTVICILQHGGGNDNHKNNRGTYGVIVNRPSISEATGRNRILADTLNFGLPKEIAKPLGGAPIKDGGPVHMPSIQLMYAVGNRDRKMDDQLNEEALLKEIGGTRIPSITELGDEKVVCFQGDIMKAAKAVTSGQLDQDDVSIFVGASCWYPGQLEKEINEGCWLLCRGPPEIALSGVCEHEQVEETEPRPKADLWLSMMSAFGDDEARLAYLMQAAHEDDEYGGPCDEL